MIRLVWPPRSLEGLVGEAGRLAFQGSATDASIPARPALDTLWPLLGQYLACFTPTACRHYIRHCGFMAAKSIMKNSLSRVLADQLLECLKLCSRLFQLGHTP